MNARIASNPNKPDVETPKRIGCSNRRNVSFGDGWIDSMLRLIGEGAQAHAVSMEQAGQAASIQAIH
jgi:hypothetical protein